jgi:DNA-binding response OmpR family regulator
LDVALHRLRRKLEVLGSDARLVNTKGVGYSLEQLLEPTGRQDDRAG